MRMRREVESGFFREGFADVADEAWVCCSAELEVAPGFAEA